MQSQRPLSMPQVQHCSWDLGGLTAGLGSLKLTAGPGQSLGGGPGGKAIRSSTNVSLQNHLI